MNTFRFKFRCSAFQIHYFDCITPAGTFEICHTGFTEDKPSATPRWGWNEHTPKPEGFDEAWLAYCEGKRLEYEAWKVKNAHLFVAA